MSEFGDGEASRLERRVRQLMRAYPAAYRANRGEEITGTLLEATPAGRKWPPARETASVIGGGLRARRDANLRQGLPASARQAAVLGAAVYLVQFSCLALGAVVELARLGIVPFTRESSYDWAAPLTGVLTTLILAAAWSGRRRLVAVAAAVTGASAAASLLITHQWDPVVVLALYTGPSLTVFMLLVRRAERLPRSLLWVVCLPVGVTLAEVLSSPYPYLVFFSGSPAMRMFLAPYTTSLSLVTVLLAVCWLATDVRPLAGVAFAFAATRFLYGFAYAGGHGAPGPAGIALAIAISLVPGGAMLWLLRRQARSTVC